MKAKTDTFRSTELMRQFYLTISASLIAVSWSTSLTLAAAADTALAPASDNPSGATEPAQAANTNTNTPAAANKFDVAQLFQPYMRDLQHRIKANWQPPAGKETRRVVVIFKINRFTGQIYGTRISESSGDAKMDAAALASVSDTAGLIPLFYLTEDLAIQFTFDYNVFVNHKLVDRTTSPNGAAAEAAGKAAAGGSHGAEITQSNIIAIAEAEQQHRLAPYKVSKREALAKAYDNAAIGMLKTDTAEAKNYFYKAVAMAPSDSTALENLDHLMSQGGLDPKKAADHLTLGEREFAQQRFRNAFVEYSRAAQIENNPDTYFHMVQSLNLLREQDKLDKWRQAVKKADSAASRVALGTALVKTGDFQGAEMQFKEALSKDPQSMSAAAMLKALPEQQSAWEKKQELRKQLFFAYAEQAIKMAKNKTPVSPTIIQTSSKDVIRTNNDGVLLLKSGNFAEAIVMFKLALSKDPNYALARNNMAIAFNNLGLQVRRDPKLALYFFERAYYLDPTNQTTIKNLNGIVKMLGKDPDRFDVRVELADSALMESDLVGQRAQLLEALKLKDDPVIRARILDADRELHSKDPDRTLNGLDDPEKERKAQETIKEMTAQAAASQQSQSEANHAEKLQSMADPSEDD